MFMFKFNAPPGFYKGLKWDIICLHTSFCHRMKRSYNTLTQFSHVSSVYYKLLATKKSVAKSLYYKVLKVIMRRPMLFNCLLTK
jgi:hypothetical protein